ncbi:TPA: hypothetical protein NPO87_005066, partial [Klebsiella quasipneumoniae subsp. quasipneumoniae]|nr:hypothetical protein [Klebsiella quasipneumoniae subsp. quasipneumoniae]
PYLKKTEILPSGMSVVLFERMEAQYYADVSRVLEAYKWDNGITFKIMMKARDGRSSKYDRDREIFKSSYRYDIPEKNLFYSVYYQVCTPGKITSARRGTIWL